MSTKSLRIFIITLSVLVTSCLKTDNKLVQNKISDLFEYCFQNELFNGTVLIASKGEIIYKKAFGYKSFAKKELLSTKSVFSLASVSKPFTSLAIMMLKEKGQLSYNDKLEKFFPDFPNANKITIYHLLTHTSGLANFLEYGGVFRINGRPGDFLDSVTNQKAFEYLSSLDTLLFEPGKHRQYSNSGYLILALIVEKVSGLPFHEFMQNNIFQPFEMKNTYVASNPQLNIHNRANGFTDYYLPDDDNLLTSGCGGMLSNVEDLYKWSKALSSEKFITKETYLEAFEIPVLNNGEYYTQATDSTFCYGFGWVFRINKNDSIIFHDGGLNACTSMLYLDLKRDFTIIILSNKGNNGPIYPIHEALINIMEGEEFSYLQTPINLKAFSLISRLDLNSAIDSCFNYWNLQNPNFDYHPGLLNSLGYFYINQEEYNKAKAVLNLNIRFHPANANVYDSYAEALMHNEEFKLAIKNYEKSLELNPNNENAMQMIERINEIIKRNKSK